MTSGFPTASMQTSAPLPSGQRPDGLDRVAAPASTVSVAPNWRASSSLRGSMSTAMTSLRAGQERAGDGRAADAAAAEDGHAVAGETSPVSIAAPRPAMTPQPRSPAASGRARGSTLVHWPAATSVRSAKAPMPRAGDSGVPSCERHLLGRVVGGEAVPGAAAPAGPALAADGPPVEDHEVPDGDRRHPRPDGVDDAGRLVAEQEREVVVDAPLAVVEVGVAHPAGLHPRRPPRPRPAPARGSSRP